jgi:hypothetical protein
MLVFPVTVLGNEVSMKKKALDRAERKASIKLWFAIRIQHDNYEYATSYNIARGLDLAASGKLRTILSEMVAEGVLESVVVRKQGRWQGNGYRLAEGTYAAPKKRSISINKRGAAIGQMEMF